MTSNNSASASPLETSFRKQVEIVRDALTSFNLLLPNKSSTAFNAALADVVNAALGLNNFIFFISNPLFQEIVPAVHQAIEDFRIANPNFKFPASTFMLTGLHARVQDAIVKKKGNSFSLLVFLPSLLFLHYFSLFPRCQFSS
jgi:hypothetical protein